MNKAAFKWLLGALLLALPVGRTSAADADAFSKVVSYQFQDSLAVPGVQTPIISPVVSYQYFEWPGDENLTFQFAPNVSYFFSGGVSLALTGQVDSMDGIPVAGAVVTFKRYGTAFWSGTSSTSGTFSAGNLHAANFIVEVTKPGFTTLVKSFTGEAGGSQSLDLVLTPSLVPPQTAATNRVPSEGAIRQPAPANPSDPNAPRLLRFNGVSQFTTDLSGLLRNRPTVVISHGWKSSPAAWGLALASVIQNHNALGANAPNIVMWDWHVQADTFAPPTDSACEQGIELGKALQSALGTDYAQHVHFIGHSLGTIVNAYACDYVHGSITRASINPPNQWSPLLTTPHVTLLDEAEVATVFGQNVTTSAAIGWRVAQLQSALALRTAAAVADWKSPVPKAAKWVDNYISLVGLQHDDAVNVCLLAPTVSFDWTAPKAALEYAHSYAHSFYSNSVWPSGAAPAVGFGKSYEGGSVFPPVGNGLTPGSLWFENLATSDPLDLRLEANPVPFEGNMTILSALTVLPAGIAMGTATNKVYDGYQTGIQWAGNIGGTVIYTTGQVVSGVWEKAGNWWDAACDTASDALNSIDPESQLAGPVTASVMGLTLQTQPAAANKRIPRYGPDGGPTGQAAQAWMTVEVPPNAGFMAFDFTVTGEPVEDSIACAVNGQNVFTLPAKFAPDGSPVSTDLIDISDFAGQTVEMFFGLVGGTSTNCTATVNGLRFITIPQPAVNVQVNSPNATVSWPAAAVGWVLESSDTLAPDSWQAVPMTGVAAEAGTAWITQPLASPKRFYRLRQSP